MFSAFYINHSLEIQGVFLDLSKFGMKIFYTFRSNGCQRVVLDGPSVSWQSIKTVVLQGSIFRLQFFP